MFSQCLGFDIDLPNSKIYPWSGWRKRVLCGLWLVSHGSSDLSLCCSCPGCPQHAEIFESQCALWKHVCSTLSGAILFQLPETEILRCTACFGIYTLWYNDPRAKSCAAVPKQRGLVCTAARKQGAGTPTVGRGMCPGPFAWVMLMQNSHLAMMEILFKRAVCILTQSTQTLLTRSVSRRISWHVKANHVNKAPQE